jgi:hypothetical protein
VENKMPIHLEITTINQAKNNKGGYHEIHKINFLGSSEHAFASIQNVITNNKIFGDSDCYLVAVEVICSNPNVYKYLMEQYSNSSDIPMSIILSNESEVW